MSDYQFDMSNFTIADALRVQHSARIGDTYGVLLIANEFIPINLFAVPMSEIDTVLNCFLQAVLETHSPTMPTPTDPIDKLIQKALEDT